MGRRASSSATGSTRRRRPTGRAPPRTDPHLVATAYLARSAELLSRAAGVLGRSRGGGAATAGWPATCARAFGRAYVTADGRAQRLARPATRWRWSSRCCRTPSSARAPGGGSPSWCAAAGHRIGTGFVGTPLVCDALAHAGALDTAYRLLLQRECPSWLYPVTMGATTIWERWDSLLPDGTVNPGEMTSFNHYALGAVADWLHRTVAGLAPAAPGYRRLRIAPRRAAA